MSLGTAVEPNHPWTQTAALLLTDIVDSTQLAEQLGDARMAERWLAHDRVARDLLARHGGREIDKTDGFLLLFRAAADAVAFAVAYHAELVGLDLRARAGLHVGSVLLRENSPADIARGAKPLELEGLAKPVAARVMSIAVGGQTLATAEAVDALGETVRRVGVEPDGTVRPETSDPVVLSHGHWQLKGVVQPVELFEVGRAGLAPLTPPPDASKAWRVVRVGDVWVPVRKIRHGLPAPRDAFVGRGADLVDLAGRLETGRLVSVVGTGGTGKTRFVTQFAWTWLGDYPGGAWFCDLSEARTVDGILYAVAKTLDVPLGKGDPIAQIGHAIAGRGRCLVVLDNFEQVARHAGETLGRWLDRASEAVFLVTTREVLGIPGETALALAPLVAEQGVDLFVARARQAKRDFVPTPEDAAAVLDLVRVLDGLPLAIELAAARVRLMAPQQLLLRMSERFKLLSSSGGRHSRQSTLRATLDWSWDLLGSDERLALAQLSVFERGFTLEAAEEVLLPGEAWPADLLQALVDKSLVRRVGDVRFDLLMSVQEYASGKLQTLGERASAELRHGRYYARYGTDDALDALDRHQGHWRRMALTADLENVVVSSRRAVARRDAEVAVAAFLAAWAVLVMRGPFALVVSLAGDVLGLPEVTDIGRGHVEGALGRAMVALGRVGEARTHFQSALAVARQPRADAARSARLEVQILSALGTLCAEQGLGSEAHENYDAALKMARQVGDRRTEALVLGNLGNVFFQEGRTTEARASYEASLALHREVGNRRSETHVLGNLGNLYRDLGWPDEAEAHLHAAAAGAREIGDRRFEATVLANLGNLHLQRRRFEVARTTYTMALEMAREVGERRLEAHLLGSLGHVSANQGRRSEARSHYEAAWRGARDSGVRRFEAIWLAHLGELLLLDGHVAEARARLEASLAISDDLLDRRQGAQGRRCLGHVCVAEGATAEARAHFEAARALAREAEDRQHEGLASRELAELALAQGRLEEARGHFEAAEVLLRAIGDPAEICHLLAGRARLEHREGRRGEANATYTEVERLANQLDFDVLGALGRALALCRSELAE